MMKLAERMPASWPSLTSSTSNSKPRRSAQRWYMRTIISAQSWASVPPSLAWISQTASCSSCSPVKSERSSRASSSALTAGDHALQLGRHRVVALLHGQLVQGLGVGDPALQVVEQVDVVLGLAVLACHPLADLGVVPQVGSAQLGLQLGQPAPQRVEVAGSGRPRPGAGAGRARSRLEITHGAGIVSARGRT